VLDEIFQIADELQDFELQEDAINKKIKLYAHFNVPDSLRIEQARLRRIREKITTNVDDEDDSELVYQV
jgi:hypothetical protein